MQPIPETCKANSIFREKFLALANHGRWLAKSLAKGSASDRPRWMNLYLLIYIIVSGEGTAVN